MSSNNPLLILLKAGLKRNRRWVFESALLPQSEHSISHSVEDLKKDHIDRYHQLVNWSGEIDERGLSETLHPCYFHLLAFKQHMQLMLHESFPFALLGLVHLTNEIRQNAPINTQAKGRLVSGFGTFLRHPKGISFTIESQFMLNDQIVWQSTSQFLAIDHSIKSAKKAQGADIDDLPEVAAQWVVGADIGRKYAKVSGDFNLIHLTDITARLFGFKHAIAHGMWSKARCLSELSDHLAQPFSCQVSFVKPLLLPSHVVMHQRQKPNEILFNLTNQRVCVLHLSASLTFG
ncbi:MaoC/PaaZ C-terminal domain-containing protein [Aliiglaciecola sp. LCG003]|uniref:MaoC/PaaZ C-terminal domain-containing protein n=1 Tax=Aliiglaciecola sp. LCG003 TaxID=3053655 RepID=UPI0025728F1A|nr:MaoC/PaaZ C-terminal domain-containing protein [Aliiglaciecola sp. LCG003]WJG10486.1 MaoC/PaaZ C-terminal domain-containing protein [Aliiglaciecola sp. LCG003]